MKTSIVYNSKSGNTEKLAKALGEKLNMDATTFNDEALSSDVLYVGFWTQAFSCSVEVQEFLGKLEGKKVFLFGTAGYNDTQEYFDNILNTVKGFINESNEIIGTFMCRGEVTAQKQDAMKNMDLEKYESMKASIDLSINHPNQSDMENLVEKI